MNNGMNIDQINKVIQKLYVYKRLEDLNYEEFKKSFNSIIRYYKTSNSESLSSITPLVLKKFQARDDYTTANISVFSSNMSKYEQLKARNIESFSNIEKVK